MGDGRGSEFELLLLVASSNRAGSCVDDNPKRIPTGIAMNGRIITIIGSDAIRLDAGDPGGNTSVVFIPIMELDMPKLKTIKKRCPPTIARSESIISFIIELTLVGTLLTSDSIEDLEG